MLNLVYLAVKTRLMLYRYQITQIAPEEKVSENNFSQVVIVGGGAGGIAAAASLLKRDPTISITVVEPSENHYYQPGWTMVGGGIFDAYKTKKSTKSVMPEKVNWVRSSVQTFEPEDLTQFTFSGITDLVQKK